MYAYEWRPEIDIRCLFFFITLYIEFNLFLVQGLSEAQQVE